MKSFAPVICGLILFLSVESAWSLDKSCPVKEPAPNPPPAAEDPKKNPDDPPKPEKPEEKPLPPIEITAPRIPQLQEKAASSTTLGPIEIERAMLWNPTELSRRAPNVTFVEAGDRRTGSAGIRGFTSSTYGNPGVVLYVDDIPITDWQMFNPDLYDVEYIKVLRGPTAETNRGASAEFGFFQIYTQQPGNTFEGNASASYGNHNTVDLRAAVGGPIVKDKVMFRLSALESHRDGYLDNTFRDSHPDYRQNLSGRLQMRVIPVPELEIGFTVAGQHAMDGSQEYVSLHASDPFKVQFNVPGHLRLDSYVGSLRVAYNAPAFDLVSVTTRQSFEADDNHTDLDFTPQPLFDFTYEYELVQWSQEFRLSSHKNERWSWLAGAYFEDRGTNSLFGNRIRDTGFIQAAPPAGLGLPFTSPVDDLRGSHLFGQAYALFGQATFAITDKLDLTFGARAEIHRDEMETHHLLFAQSQNVRTQLFEDQGQSHSRALLPKVEATYKVKPDVSLYAAGGSGYRPGGFAYLIDDTKLNEWKPEYSGNAEVGMKSTWLNKKVALDLSFFYTRMEDYQVRRIANFMFRVDNAERVSSRGGEMQLRATPVAGLDILASFGYADAHFDRYSDRLTGQSFDGHALNYSSRYTYSLAAEYLHPSGFFIRGEYNGRSSVPFNEENTLEQRAYGVLNAKTGYERERFGIYFFTKNALDQRYGHFGIPGAGNALVGSPGDPRVYGVEVNIKF